jgi:cytochrome c peroxidase
MLFNTPTVFNSGFNFRLGWQGRATSLRELTLGTLRNGHLMSGHGLAGSRLAADPQMAARFRSIYHAAPGEANVADALSAFVATLATPDSAFDRWMGGDRSAMTAQQVRGYRRFTALGCASCHQGRNVGGNLSQRRGIFHPLGDPTRRSCACPACAMWPSPRPISMMAACRTCPKRSGRWRVLSSISPSRTGM